MSFAGSSKRLNLKSCCISKISCTQSAFDFSSLNLRAASETEQGVVPKSLDYVGGGTVPSWKRDRKGSSQGRC